MKNTITFRHDLYKQGWEAGVNFARGQWDALSYAYWFMSEELSGIEAASFKIGIQDGIARFAQKTTESYKG